MFRAFPNVLFEQTEEKLVFGSIFIIPDDESGLESRSRRKGRTHEHPFVVIKYDRMTTKIVTCAIRTTNPQAHGMRTPANLLPRLDKEGIIATKRPWPLDAQVFVGGEYLGRLPEPFLSQLRDLLRLEGWM